MSERRMLRISDIRDNAVKILFEDLLYRCELKGECWVWTGAVQYRGHIPVVRRSNQLFPVKRYVYERLNGLAEPGTSIVNTNQCEYPKLCVNPAHIYLKKRRRGGFRKRTYGLPIR